MTTRLRYRAARGAVLSLLLLQVGCSDPARSHAPRSSASTTTSGTTTAPTPEAVDVPLGAVPGTATALAFDPEGALLVAERAGRVWRIATPGAPRSTRQQQPPTLVLDVATTTTSSGAADGLLAVEMSTDRSRLLVVRTRPDGDLVLESYPFRATPPIDPATGRMVASIAHPYVHKGGGLVVLDDGSALLSVGAFRRPGPLDPQNPDGSVLRVPAEVLRSADPTRWEPTFDDVVVRGLRNPWRISVDPATRDLWIGDVGEHAVEEVDRIPAADWRDGPRGERAANLGWPYVEGDAAYLDGAPAGAAFRAPAFTYEHDDGRCAVIGGVVYRGVQLAELTGHFLFGDVCSNEVWAIDPSDERPEPSVVASLRSPPTALTAGPDGEVVVAHGDGGISALAPAGSEVSTPPDAVCDLADALEGLSGFEDLGSSELRRRVDAVADALEAPDEALPEHLRDRVEALRAAFMELHRLGEAAAWDTSDPALRRAVRESAAERGPHASQLADAAALVDAARDCR